MEVVNTVEVVVEEVAEEEEEVDEARVVMLTKTICMGSHHTALFLSLLSQTSACQKPVFIIFKFIFL